MGSRLCSLFGSCVLSMAAFVVFGALGNGVGCMCRGVAWMVADVWVMYVGCVW